MLGGGSNTVADDTGYPGTVIRMATRGIAVRPLGGDVVEVTAQAGEPLDALVAFTVAEGLSGIEYLGGIPGTTGAAPIQNTGAYGQQISDTLTRLTVYDWALGHTRALLPGECGFVPHQHVQDPTRTIHDPRRQPASGTSNRRLPRPLPAARRRTGRTPRRPATTR